MKTFTEDAALEVLLLSINKSEHLDFAPIHMRRYFSDLDYTAVCDQESAIRQLLRVLAKGLCKELYLNGYIIDNNKE